MKSKICILKAGSAIEPARRELGDFEDFIVSRMGINPQQVALADLQGDTHAPLPEKPAGIIVTGARLMVADRGDIFFRLISLLGEYLKRKVPILGICYGHQVLASLFGGSVEFLNEGVEIGTVKITSAPSAAEDDLFSVLPETFYGQASHRETVDVKPATSICCAGGERDRNHALSFGEGAWGVQFHPEFNEEIMKTYLSAQRENLEEEGCDVDELLRNVREDDTGASILRRFRDLALG